MELRRRRSQQEEPPAAQLGEVEEKPSFPVDQSETASEVDASGDRPKVGKGQHAEPLPGGGYMIITNGF